MAAPSVRASGLQVLHSPQQENFSFRSGRSRSVSLPKKIFPIIGTAAADHKLTQDTQARGFGAAVSFGSSPGASLPAPYLRTKFIPHALTPSQPLFGAAMPHNVTPFQFGSVSGTPITYSGFQFGATAGHAVTPSASLFEAAAGSTITPSLPDVLTLSEFTCSSSLSENNKRKKAQMRIDEGRGHGMDRLTSLREREKSRGLSWGELFDLQHQDGYWECTGRLGSILGLDIEFFANVFLKEKGIISLGVRAHADILRLVATLLVLQLMRVMGLAEGSLLKTLFRLEEVPALKSTRWEAVKRAVDWVSWADRQYPCVCSRLEFGQDWESATRQLLGVDPPHPYSPLHPILERSAGIQAQ
ncbi:hypothetical protein MATL_G00151430 [Megalops atlanticus]|uniref:PARP4 MVP-ID C-terminal domain-containing protein n=1 Tax=Megalops atlanticus TaxID=7932 RepID=A0A9D3PUH5_MEGAT|nr:hypothetical protein MATL_G00151430 [Megalops atlanticus]